MFVTANQLLAHAVGDYVLQSDWMAQEKTKSGIVGISVALAHAFCYVLPFLFITTNSAAVLFMVFTHAAIDHWRLARHVCWLKNFLSPPKRIGPWEGERQWRFPWSECQPTGYHKDKPAWLTVWLLIITDNIMHIALNALAIYLWP